MSEFCYTPLLPVGETETRYKCISDDYVRVTQIEDQQILHIASDAFTHLAEQALADISYLLRPSHLAQLRAILDDAEATKNDRFVALEMLKNAVISADRVLPMCQDTGTALVNGTKGAHVLTQGDEAEAIAKGIYNVYQKHHLRFSQLAPLTMFEEKNTGTNLPAQIDIAAGPGHEYHFTFIQKGGGSANKTFLFQKTKAVLNEASLKQFLKEAIMTLGTAACPPYHLAVVIGGTSAEFNLKTVKKASVRDLDTLPTAGTMAGHGWRDLEWEQIILHITRELGIGAQFGGKYYCHDVRVIRLPRHGASCPIGIGVSCSADRQMRAKITSEGLFLEQLETNPARFLPDIVTDEEGDEPVVDIDLNQPMAEITKTLSGYPVKTRVRLTGPMIVARDIAHAKLHEILEATGDLPDYFKKHPIYYAGPAKTPDGMASGAFGPTTAGRMDDYVAPFQAVGGSMVMLAKGNRSAKARKACQQYGGFYLGSIGGVAAKLALESIKSVEVLEFAELGMEAVWRIEVENFPAFIIIDDKGNDFFTID